LTVGYVAASRHLGHAASAYALLAHGLGRAAGVAGAAVALVSYSAIGTSLYGFLGVVMASWLQAGAWWQWAMFAWAVVALLGVSRFSTNVAFIALIVTAQLLVVAAIVTAGLTNPAAGRLTWEGFAPNGLFVTGVGGALAFALAAFVGYESGPVYSEETRLGGRVGRATFAALGSLGLLYPLQAWALAQAVGTDRIAATAADPDAGLPFVLLGHGWAPLALGVLVVAIFASIMSFHHTVARYLFALGREHVAPVGLSRVGRRGPHAGAPVAASATPSLTSLGVIVAVAAMGGHPIVHLFTPLSTLAAIGVLTLLVACSWAAGRFFRQGGGTHEGVLTRRVAPILGVVLGAAVLVVMVSNLHALLAVEPGAPLTWILPGIIGAAALVGLCWAGWLRTRRPTVWQGIGRGRPHPLRQLDHHFAELSV
jgi:amino acid transporter